MTVRSSSYPTLYEGSIPFARSKLKSHNLNFPFVNNKLQLYFFVLLSLTFNSLNIKLSLLPGLPGPAGKQQEVAS